MKLVIFVHSPEQLAKPHTEFSKYSGYPTGGDKKFIKNCKHEHKITLGHGTQNK